jgi:hypothetical protein
MVIGVALKQLKADRIINMLKKLLQKAEKNKDTGVLAEDKKHYDAAISRFYYELYEKMLVICDHYGILKTKTDEKDNHKDTIDKFLDEIKCKADLPPCYEIQLFAFRKLSICRNKSDYRDCIIDNADKYKKVFKEEYKLIRNSLNFILVKIGA